MSAREQPRWPARTPASLGGQFRPTGLDLDSRAMRLFLGVAQLVDDAATGAGGDRPRLNPTQRRRLIRLVHTANTRIGNSNWSNRGNSTDAVNGMRNVLRENVLNAISPNDRRALNNGGPSSNESVLARGAYRGGMERPTSASEDVRETIRIASTERGGGAPAVTEPEANVSDEVAQRLRDALTPSQADRANAMDAAGEQDERRERERTRAMQQSGNARTRAEGDRRAQRQAQQERGEPASGNRRPDLVGQSPARSPSGRHRNYRQMSDAKLVQLATRMHQGNGYGDPEAVSRINDALRARGMDAHLIRLRGDALGNVQSGGARLRAAGTRPAFESERPSTDAQVNEIASELVVGLEPTIPPDLADAVAARVETYRGDSENPEEIQAIADGVRAGGNRPVEPAAPDVSQMADHEIAEALQRANSEGWRPVGSERAAQAARMAELANEADRRGIAPTAASTAMSQVRTLSPSERPSDLRPSPPGVAQAEAAGAPGNPARSAAGRPRNFRAMSNQKLAEVVASFRNWQFRGGRDEPARRKLNAELQRREQSRGDIVAQPPLIDAPGGAATPAATPPSQPGTPTPRLPDDRATLRQLRQTTASAITEGRVTRGLDETFQYRGQTFTLRDLRDQLRSHEMMATALDNLDAGMTPVDSGGRRLEVGQHVRHTGNGTNAEIIAVQGPTVTLRDGSNEWDTPTPEQWQVVDTPQESAAAEATANTDVRGAGTVVSTLRGDQPISPSELTPHGMLASTIAQRVPGAHLAVNEAPSGRYARIQAQVPNSRRRRTLAYVRHSPRGRHQISFTRGTPDELFPAGTGARAHMNPTSDAIGVRGHHFQIGNSGEARAAARALERTVGATGRPGAIHAAEPSVQQAPQPRGSFRSAQEMAEHIVAHADALVPGDEPSFFGVETPSSGEYARIVLEDPEQVDSRGRYPTVAYVRPNTGGTWDRTAPQGERSQLIHRVTFTRGDDQVVGEGLPESSAPAAGVRNGFTVEVRTPRNETTPGVGARRFEQAAQNLLQARTFNPRPTPPGRRRARRQSQEGRPGTVEVPARRRQRMDTVLGPGRNPIVGLAATGRNSLLPEAQDANGNDIGVQGRSVSIELEVNGTDPGGAHDRAAGERVVSALRAAGLPTARYHPHYAQTENVPDGGVDVGAVTWDYTARGHEITIPVSRGDDGIEVVKTMVRTVKGIPGARQGPQADAGIHVHIGTRDLSREAKRRICQLYGNNDALIDSLVSPRRRTSRWGGSGYGGNEPICGNGHGGARINTAESHGTYEFRRLGSNLNAEFVGSWSQMLMYMVQYAKDHSGEMPTFSRLEDFLDELGLPEGTKQSLLDRAQQVANRANQ